MEQPKNILNIMIEMPQYFNTWLFLNDFKFKRHSLKENKVYFESKEFVASINASRFCRIESKVDHEILFVFLIPMERIKFSGLKEIIGRYLGFVTQDVG